MRTPLFLGIDAGGTRTRAVLADADGDIIGTGEAGPANVVGPEQERALLRMGEAAAAARGATGPESIAAVCAGAAGVLSLPEVVGERFGDQLQGVLGVDRRPDMVSDTVTAFAAGTAEPDGTVVIAGTGAVALAVRGHTEPVARADGHGWLLGDAGSGYWIGREAVSATLRHLDGHGPGGWMAEAVIAEIAPPSRASAAIIGRCMADSPVRLSRFAPIVCEAADGGDPVAAGIVERAVAHLSDTAVAVAEARLPVVLAGSLLTRETPVARGLRALLSERLPDAPLLAAAEPARGAAWLAARARISDAAERRRLHRRLTEE
ncbi:BadF/BadG/BcrA/BcrD ATPase family protein [Glycomyces halotolerans]